MEKAAKILTLKTIMMIQWALPRIPTNANSRDGRMMDMVLVMLLNRTIEKKRRTCIESMMIPVDERRPW